MKLRTLSMIFLSTVLLSGCATGKPASETTGAAGAEIERETGSNIEGNIEDNSTESFDGLTLDKYEGLEIVAEVLQRNAILPGSTIPVTVIIKNTGEETISFVKGSGSFKTPQALDLSIEGLQPILPEDHLGPATMDFVTEQLKSGEELRYVLNIRAIEPNDDFDTYTYDQSMKEPKYIGDIEWETLQELYPEFKAADTGSYEGMVTFVYSIVDGSNNAFAEPSGYSQAKLKITVD